MRAAPTIAGAYNGTGLEVSTKTASIYQSSTWAYFGSNGSPYVCTADAEL